MCCQHNVIIYKIKPIKLLQKTSTAVTFVYSPQSIRKYCRCESSLYVLCVRVVIIWISDQFEYKHYLVFWYNNYDI